MLHRLTFSWLHLQIPGVKLLDLLKKTLKKGKAFQNTLGVINCDKNILQNVTGIDL